MDAPEAKTRIQQEPQRQQLRAVALGVLLGVEAVVAVSLIPWLVISFILTGPTAFFVVAFLLPAQWLR